VSRPHADGGVVRLGDVRVTLTGEVMEVIREQIGGGQKDRSLVVVKREDGRVESTTVAVVRQWKLLSRAARGGA
jgi:hypothetical protein